MFQGGKFAQFIEPYFVSFLTDLIYNVFQSITNWQEVVIVTVKEKMFQSNKPAGRCTAKHIMETLENKKYEKRHNWSIHTNNIMQRWKSGVNVYKETKVLILTHYLRRRSLIYGGRTHKANDAFDVDVLSTVNFGMNLKAKILTV